MKNLFILAFLTLLAGCQTYQSEITLPGSVKTYAINPIISRSPVFTALITDSLNMELSRYFESNPDSPDFVVKGSATIEGEWMPDYIGYALIELHDHAGKKLGFIRSEQGWVIPDSPATFTKKIAKIIKRSKNNP